MSGNEQCQENVDTVLAVLERYGGSFVISHAREAGQWLVSWTPWHTSGSTEAVGAYGAGITVHEALAMLADDLGSV